MTDRPPTGSQTQSRSPPAAAKSARPDFVAHTELVSADPTATKAWCNTILGWTFESVDYNGQPYEMWSGQNDTGGGIRKPSGSETPGAVPYVEVEDVRAVYRKAIDSGAMPLSEPQQLPDDSWVASVMAPGTVPVGFWSPGSPQPRR